MGLGAPRPSFSTRRVGTNLGVYHTRAKGTYFFVFDPNTSTQNPGNLDRVDFTGAEIEVQGRILDGFDGYLGLGFTHSDIKESRRDASDVGNQAPWFRSTRPTWGCNTAMSCAPG